MHHCNRFCIMNEILTVTEHLYRKLDHNCQLIILSSLMIKNFYIQRRLCFIFIVWLLIKLLLYCAVLRYAKNEKNSYKIFDMFFFPISNDSYIVLNSDIQLWKCSWLLLLINLLLLLLNFFSILCHIRIHINRKKERCLWVFVS